MTVEGGHILTFHNVVPDWSSASAALNFALHMAVGEQSHDSASTVIQLQKGPPAPTDAIAVLLGNVNGQNVVLNSTSWVDRASDMTLKIFEYDPRKVKTLYLLLLPILPDKATKLQKRSKVLKFVRPLLRREYAPLNVFPYAFQAVKLKTSSRCSF